MYCIWRVAAMLLQRTIICRRKTASEAEMVLMNTNAESGWGKWGPLVSTLQMESPARLDILKMKDKYSRRNLKGAPEPIYGGSRKSRRQI